MITSLALSEVATFTDVAPVVIRDLRPVNFFYGSNGTGKTTISRLLADPSSHPSCRVDWQGPARKTVVYNRDFVRDNFGPNQELPGIFTLGQDDTQAQATLAQKQEERKRREAQRTDLAGQRQAKQDELDKAWDSFKSQAWALKKGLDADFRALFAGAGTKENFAQRLLESQKEGKGQTFTLEQLRERVTTLFGHDPQAESPVPIPSIDALGTIQAQEILYRPILARTDAPMAALIQRLTHGDWVRQGRRLHEATGHTQCPYCQQSTAESIREGLDQVFDKAYEDDLRCLHETSDAWIREATVLSAQCQALRGRTARFLDPEAVEHRIAELGQMVNDNKRALQARLGTPSRVAEFTDLGPATGALTELAIQANARIDEHNRLVAARGTEQARLKQDVWRFIVEQRAGEALAIWGKVSINLQKTIEGMKGREQNLVADIRALEAAIAELESRVVSVQPTIRAINRMLDSFDFHAFRLAESTRQGFYRVIRPDGTEVADTLSEGERTFLTFLYFIHSVQGSTARSGIAEERVVVLDDPVSSLDSQVLHVVSTLVRQVIAQVGKGPVCQVIVLTHNVYFHKEVSYNQEGKQVAWWTVQKKGQRSTVRTHSHNPVQSTYQRLWAELKEPDSSAVSVQNTIRRILQSYFKLIGREDIQKKVERTVEPADQVIAQSFFSWINEGSHGAMDDDHGPRDPETVGAYLKVFQRVFQVAGHQAHYEMMMRGE